MWETSIECSIIERCPNGSLAGRKRRFNCWIPTRRSNGEGAEALLGKATNLASALSCCRRKNLDPIPNGECRSDRSESSPLKFRQQTGEFRLPRETCQPSVFLAERFRARQARARDRDSERDLHRNQVRARQARDKDLHRNPGRRRLLSG